MSVAKSTATRRKPDRDAVIRPVVDLGAMMPV
jgi:hypothetical protein